MIFYRSFSEILLTCQDHGNKITELSFIFYNVIFEHKLYDILSVSKILQKKMRLS